MTMTTDDHPTANPDKQPSASTARNWSSEFIASRRRAEVDSPMEPDSLNRLLEVEAEFEATRNETSGANPHAIKFGVGILIGGFLVTALGAALLAQGATSYEAAADVIHRIGKWGMFGGLVVVLTGYRWRFLTTFLGELAMGPANQIPGQFAEDHRHADEKEIRSDLQDKPPTFQISLLALLILMTVTSVAVGLLFSLPAQPMLLLIFCLNILLLMLLTIALVYGRGYVRTFCIGGLFPAGAVVCLQLLAAAPLMSFIMMQSQFPQSLFNVSGLDLFSFRCVIGLVWMGVLIFGALAVMTRFVVERNPHRR